MNNSSKNNLIVTLRESSQSFFRFVKSQEAIAFISAIILLGKLHFHDVSIASKVSFDFLFSRVVWNVGNVESV